MHKYLLDTNVVSELRRQRPHGGVVAWLQSLDDTQLHLSAVTLGEIGWLSFFSMIGFLGVLTVGFIYEWRKGALDWE